jgi:hypothetical protein
MNIHKISAKAIIKECSSVHTQSVIEDLVKQLKQHEQFFQDLASINTKCPTLGAGRLANIVETSERFIKNLNN